MQKPKKLLFSDLGFVLSLIGAAVGLGNIWRFPQTLAQSGGSAFVIIYFLCLFLIALPIALLEMNYGLFFRKGIVNIFQQNIPKIGRFLGWKQIFLIGGVGCYYIVIMTWVGLSLGVSIIPSLFQQSATESQWFKNHILASNSNNDFAISVPVIIGTLFFIAFIFIVLSFGIRNGLEKLNVFVVPGLFLGLIGLTIYVLTLKNAFLGVEHIFRFESAKFKEPVVWVTALKQVIFSTGILMGILIVFSNSSDKRTDKGNQALIVILADTLIGFIAGVLIMSIIANKATTDLSPAASTGEIREKMDVLISKQGGGATLIFSFLPVFFYKLDQEVFNGFGQILMFIFMLTLLFAAISSLAALVEVFINSLVNNFASLTRLKALLIWAGINVLAAFLYSISFGANLIDLQDMLILFFIVLIGVFETVSFPLGRKYSQIVKENDPYTFLKIGPFNWLKKLLIWIIAPLLACIFILDFIYIFGQWFNINLAGFPVKSYDAYQLETIILAFTLTAVWIGAALGMTIYQTVKKRQIAT